MQASDRLMQLVFDAVEQGLKPLQARHDFVPFVLTITREGVVLRRYETASNADALAQMRDLLRTNDEIQAYALAFDAMMTVDETDYDAILIEAAERGQPQGWRFAQRYRPPADKRPVQTIGQLALIGHMENYLHQPDDTRS